MRRTAFPIGRRALLGAAASFLATPSRAQAFPTKTIQLVVPFAAGGAADIIGRAIGERLSQGYGRPVIVENRPGAGSNTGLASVARAEPDGHVIGLASMALAVNPSLYRSMPFDPVADLAPLSLALETPNILIVPANSPYRSVGDLIAAAKRAPGLLVYASAGLGSSLHLAAELFRQKASVDLTHAPYRGSSPALVDLIAGRVHVMFDNASTALPQIEAGTVRAIGVTTAARIAALPQVPTIAEQGVPDYALANWWGFVAAARTPPAIVERLGADIQAALRHEATERAFAPINARIIASTPQAFASHLATEIGQWRAIVASAGLTALD
ncbi:Bug family tripartite tricarboxylate transporter substrate binding protein [Phreatobacter oligotrophus]|uniref:Tripartite-type tricarboxylate transporter receptor subunit TctC n=1 Tax=Phreatobacter oligotrophus TaxID=1122261 RepID=A0A2T4YY51_9HYPH|nr:tripartite tricarboxylate transporter substrate binding protein [Phreatobacter oligotrophus]PTM51479.1 tripartite-type tricarboxylate transporter receptor subunit TctC [Phreatobacter oligotrophus]